MAGFRLGAHGSLSFFPESLSAGYRVQFQCHVIFDQRHRAADIKARRIQRATNVEAVNQRCCAFRDMMGFISATERRQGRDKVGVQPAGIDRQQPARLRRALRST